MVRPQGGFSSWPGPGCRHEDGDRKKRMEKQRTVEVEHTWWLSVDREKERAQNNPECSHPESRWPGRRPPLRSPPKKSYQ